MQHPANLVGMTAAEIDAHLASIAEPKRSTLEEVRRRILEIIPEAEQCISYNMPCFKVEGKAVAGFDAFTHHLSYFPHSGHVFQEMPDALAGYTFTKGSLHFAIDEPLPRDVIAQLLHIRMQQAGL